MTAPRRWGSLLLARIVLLGLANGLLWAALVPPWQTPDEPKHYEYARLMAERGQLVAFASEAEAADPELQAWILGSMDEHRFWWFGRAPAYEPGRPVHRFADVWVMGMHTALYRSSPLYYWLVARLQPADRLWGLYWGRLLSVFLGVVVVMAAGVVARELFGDEPLVRYGVPLFVALHPMFAFAQAGVNNDSLLNALAAVTFLWMVRCLVRGTSVTRLATLAISLGLALVVKRTAVFLLPPAVLALVLASATRARQRWATLAVSLLAVIAVGLGSWRLWQAGGASILPAPWRDAALRYLFNEPDQPTRMLAVLRSPAGRAVLLEYGWRMHDTFWGSYGWDVIRYARPLYAAFAVLGALGVLGFVARALRRRLSWPQGAAVLTSMAALGGTVVAACLFFGAYLTEAYAPPPQGRYLMATVIPYALVLVAGLGGWLAPDRQARALRVLLVALLAFDVGTLVGLVIPYYYG